MSMEDYEKALRLGQKKYREQASSGNYPYLPVLDDLLAQTDIESRTSLGTIDVPLELIVGTSTEGRTTAFASNFMPLLGPDSEFASKWSQLVDALIDEGQRDPIIAYEFMGKYYVVEGNKRVSVSKYLGSVSVYGTVTRIVPKLNDDPEVKLYYEYLEFYNVSHINYIWFSKEGSYRRLMKILDNYTKIPWTDEERALFRSSWLTFNKEFKALGGDKLSCTPADAMLAYIELFDYASLFEDTPATIRSNMTKIWDEFLLIDKDDSVALVMVPNEEAPKKGLLSKLLSPDPEHLRVAFIHNKTAETSAWTYGHELGRAHVEQVFGDTIETCCMDNIEPGDAYAAIEKAIADGYNVIFTTTPEFVNDSLKSAIAHPDIRVLNCSLNIPHRFIRTYYGRMYEAKFLSGVLAGTLTRNHRVGYIADYPIYGMTANINAFALGAKMVDPEVKVYLEWSTLKDSDPYENLKKNDVVIISDKEMINPSDSSREFGLYAEKDGVKTNLAMPIWHWGVFYERIIRSILSGAWKADGETDDLQAVNYWWGMSAGTIDLIYSDKIPSGTLQLVHILKEAICHNHFVPFTGPLLDQDGTLRCEDKVVMPPEDVIVMDWLSDNVIGRIPALDELVDDARKVAVHYGIAPDNN
ncbi:basic membrane lipoprotein Med (substrate-binding protein (PBP1-ABC) superfamily) [Catenibacillus scindens]|uniref:Basic membrane lipoprotein Med (Substrate-binding protein (PBP1-ABC) superfamily) n=1 Tax=Catenibacillus scindens TaxID=673271 RepID=A0A7W8HBZ3_9FIRM|nr:BMP family ABC transporter substrate-binding protein [Catenibacillus scindens]MBB5264920.1 basic membrane lipoprotein Med (substrate-binding protein (PBP1-ABC) superfamily) [Catenibacillus scindens]